MEGSLILPSVLGNRAPLPTGLGFTLPVLSLPEFRPPLPTAPEVEGDSPLPGPKTHFPFPTRSEQQWEHPFSLENIPSHPRARPHGFGKAATELSPKSQLSHPLANESRGPATHRPLVLMGHPLPPCVQGQGRTLRPDLRAWTGRHPIRADTVQSKRIWKGEKKQQLS